MHEACQRWNHRRARYRPAGETIDASRYGVELVDEATAKPFVVRHHYSGSYPAARRQVGLLEAGVGLVGVAVFSVPAQKAAIPAWTGRPASEGVELGRFVLLDAVPGNGETWFLARAFRALVAELPELRAVLAYSDPVERTTIDGEVVKRGHVGTIYKAHNATSRGLSKAETLVLTPDGRALSRRSLSKIRNDEQGAAGAYARLIAAGAPARRPFEDGAAYVARALAEGPFRRVRHPGNHVFTWEVGRG